MDRIIIDATGHIVGRLASRAAKEALKGKSIYIVNAEKAVISGNPQYVIDKYRQWLERGDPYAGPHFPRRPDRILKRVIRGMLPYKKPRGREALKRIKVFVSVPDEFKNIELKKIADAVSTVDCKTITLGELAERLGAKVTW
ncbi:MAG: 50S ribosomal protein L13 [Candidatus Aenigmatarchaeota archaeon]|nr:MAG: 50S ribosomal protein L13 [Candidatus Aenigmarchaeota archaeon]